MVTGDAAFGKRSGHASLVYDNKIWVIGGLTEEKKGGNQVYYSSDGKTWTEATSGAPWGNRSNLKAVVFKNKMWVMGGLPEDFNPQNPVIPSDVYSSTDGKTWTKETESTQWAGRFDFGLLAFDNKMWVLGGLSFIATDYYNDVWSSTDGINWTQATTSAEWSKRAGSIVTIFKNKAMVIAGSNGNNSIPDDVWSLDISTDVLHNQNSLNAENNTLCINSFRLPGKNSLMIDYYVNRSGPVSIRVFDANGNQVAMLLNGIKSTGLHSTLWKPALNVRSGLYIVNYKIGGFSQSRQIILQQ